MRSLKAWFADWWKTIVFIFVCIFACSLLTVFAICYAANTLHGPADARFGLTDTGISSRVITDSKTGVYYLVIDGTGVTPLLSADGLPLMVDDANHGDVDAAIEAARGNMGVTG